MLNIFKRFKRDEKGVTLVEYGIGIALAVALGTTALLSLAQEVGGTMNAAGGKMPGDADTTISF